MLKVSKLSKSFASDEILKDISFHLEKGDKASLVGPGASGKTTVLKILLGLISPDVGEAKVSGKELYDLGYSDKKKLMERIGVAFQQGALFDFLSVEANLQLALAFKDDLSGSEKDSLIDEKLAQVKLSHTKKQFPFELSGGMQKRIGLARAMVAAPEICFLDEPTAGLDPVTSSIILEMIEDMQKESTVTSLVFTSNIEIAMRFSRRMILLKDGYVHADGDWAEMIESGDKWTKNFLCMRLKGLESDYLKNMNLPGKALEIFSQR